MVVLYRGGSADPDLSAADLHHAEPVVSDDSGRRLEITLPAMWNFQNYIDVFKSGDLWMGFKNSIVLVVETVVLEIVFSALAAYGLARSNR